MLKIVFDLLKIVVECNTISSVYFSVGTNLSSSSKFDIFRVFEFV